MTRITLVRIILWMLPFYFPLNSTAQNPNIEKRKNETSEQLVSRLIPPGSMLVHKIVEMNFIKSKAGKSILYCYTDTTEFDRSAVECRLLFPYFLEKNHVIYDTDFVCTLEPGAATSAKIRSIFQANADKDSVRELFIIYSTDLREYNTELSQWYVETYNQVLIFDDVADPCNEGVCIERMEKLERTFPSSLQPYTASTIKKKLLKLGIKNRN